MHRPFRLPTIAFALAFAWCLPAFAAPPAASSDPAASEEALIKHGLELRQARQDEAALREFRRAWDLSRSGRALAQIALAEQALGRWLEAEEDLKSALEHDDEEWVDRNRDLLAQALHEIQGHLGWVELTGDMPSGQVTINGKRIATLPVIQPLRAPAGSIAVEVHAAGYLPILRMVVVPARGLAREPLVFVPAALAKKPLPPALEPVAAEETKPEPTRVGPWKPRHTAGVVFGAAALGSLATGIAFHVVREERASTYRDLRCEAPTAPGQFDDCRSRYDGIKTATYVTIAGYAGAAIFSGVAAYLFFGVHDEARTTAATNRSPPTCGLALGPGLVCAGRF